MNNPDHSGCTAVFVFIVYVFVWVGTGVAAWNWIEPKTFWGAIKFLIVWGILGYVVNIIGGIIITFLIASNNDK